MRLHRDVEMLRLLEQMRIEPATLAHSQAVSRLAELLPGELLPGLVDIRHRVIIGELAGADLQDAIWPAFCELIQSERNASSKSLQQDGAV